MTPTLLMTVWGIYWSLADSQVILSWFRCYRAKQRVEWTFNALVIWKTMALNAYTLYVPKTGSPFSKLTFTWGYAVRPLGNRSHYVSKEDRMSINLGGVTKIQFIGATSWMTSSTTVSKTKLVSSINNNEGHYKFYEYSNPSSGGWIK